jgi:hypothetical protein
MAVQPDTLPLVSETLVPPARTVIDWLSALAALRTLRPVVV